MGANMKIQKFLPTILHCASAALFLSACAGPESYQQKMERYTPKAISKNQVPEIKTVEIKFARTQNESKGRLPASVKPIPQSNELEMEGNPTNKKLYFLTLFSQYESLKKYSGEFIGPSVSICPNFHTSLVRHNEKNGVPLNASSPVIKKFSYEAQKYSSDTYVAGHPELLLPLSKDETTPKVIDVLRSSKDTISDFNVNEMVHKALDIHLAKTYAEIRELCEYGVSDNYYIYENLITHIKNNKFEADTKNMNTLLKTTLFSNMAIMASIDQSSFAKNTGRSLASVSENSKAPYAHEVMSRLNVSWANQYFKFIQESR